MYMFHQYILLHHLKIYLHQIYNQAGELVVPAGAVADDGMLAGMSFYVQGIEGDLPQ